RLPDSDDEDAIDEAETGSVTAEITPRVRQKLGHPDWVFSNINDFEGQFVRLTGWLMLDTKHIPQDPDTPLLPNEHRNKGLSRATNWEIHPVTKFEICKTTVVQCRQGQGWEAVP